MQSSLFLEGDYLVAGYEATGGHAMARSSAGSKGTSAWCGLVGCLKEKEQIYLEKLLKSRRSV